jgi:hypothetical protein
MRAPSGFGLPLPEDFNTMMVLNNPSIQIIAFPDVTPCKPDARIARRKIPLSTTSADAAAGYFYQPARAARPRWGRMTTSAVAAAWR